jgi:DNA-binding transcriptional MerR regulator
VRSRNGQVMTVGELSRRTGVPAKQLREYEDMGLIYTVGRSAGNYRLFDEAALWCVERIRNLRSLGLTVAEIRDLTEIYLARPTSRSARTWPSGYARHAPVSTPASPNSRRRADASTPSRNAIKRSCPRNLRPISAPVTRVLVPPALDPHPRVRL